MAKSFLAFVLMSLLTACSAPQRQADPSSECGAVGERGIVVADAWVRAAGEGRMMSAAYLTLCNAGDTDDKLLRVSADVAEAAEIHQSSRDSAGVASMAPVASIDLPTHQKIALAPGGAHIMLIGLAEPIEPGAKVSLVLEFENSPALTLEAEARSLGAVAH